MEIPMKSPKVPTSWWLNHVQSENSHENSHHLSTLGRITVEMYKDPPRMVDEMSALGLRHVGYGIPTAPWNQIFQHEKRQEKSEMI